MQFNVPYHFKLSCTFSDNALINDVNIMPRWCSVESRENFPAIIQVVESLAYQREVQWREVASVAATGRKLLPPNMHTTHIYVESIGPLVAYAEEL